MMYFLKINNFIIDGAAMMAPIFLNIYNGIAIIFSFHNFGLNLPKLEAIFEEKMIRTKYGYTGKEISSIITSPCL